MSNRLHKDDAYDIIFGLNEDAHHYTWNLWEEAGEDEGLREDASLAQQETFRELFYDLDEETQDDVWHYVNTDEDFATDFNAWYGED